MKIKIPDLDLEKTMDSGQIFRMYKNEDASFTIYSADKRLEIRPVTIGNYEPSNDGAGNADIYELSCDEAQYENYWRRYFDADTDYTSLYDAVDENDGFLQGAVKYGRGIRILRQDTWEMIISFIISQQKRIPEIRRCIEGLCKRLGEKQTDAKTGAQWYTFPDAAAIATAGPDGLKDLSFGYRERYIYETALRYLHDEYMQSGEIKKMSYDKAKAHLKTYLGIGEKVANCICLFGLGMIDAFPIDVHIKDILYREYYKGCFPKNLLGDKDYAQLVDENFSKYSGFRGIVQQWIFAYELNVK